MPSQPELSLSSATQLAHAMIAHVAATQRIRLLAIKGPVTDHYGFRTARVSADADVWVEPSRYAELRSLLEARGWHARVGRETPSPLPLHSATLIHPEWPCDIDLHWTFPGFFAGADAAFDALWDHRRRLEVAHRDEDMPSRAGAAVISMLHALRHNWMINLDDERRRVESMVHESFSPEERAEFYEIARRGGALWVLREIVDSGELGPPVVDATSREQQMWRLQQELEGSSAGWMIQLRATPWLRAPAFLLRAAWVPRREIPRNDPSVLPTLRESAAYQVARWRRGVRGSIAFLRRH